jgi:hypothetical protein
MVEMADMNMRIETQLNFARDVFQLGFTFVVKVVKEHE